MSETPSNPPSPDEPQGQQRPPLPPQAPQQQVQGGPGYGQYPQQQPQRYAPQPGPPPAQPYGQQGQPGFAPPPPQPGYGQQYAQQAPQQSPQQGFPQQQPRPVPGQQPYGQPGYTQQPQPSGGGNDILVAMLAHLTGFMFAFLGWIPPLAIYFAKRNTSPFVRHHAAEAANFQITMLIPYVFAGVLYVGLGIFFGNLAWIGSLFIALVWILSIVFGVLGASGANKGAWYRYPFSIRLLK